MIVKICSGTMPVWCYGCGKRVKYITLNGGKQKCPSCGLEYNK